MLPKQGRAAACLACPKCPWLANFVLRLVFKSNITSWVHRTDAERARHTHALRTRRARSRASGVLGAQSSEPGAAGPARCRWRLRCGTALRTVSTSRGVRYRYHAESRGRADRTQPILYEHVPRILFGGHLPSLYAALAGPTSFRDHQRTATHADAPATRSESFLILSGSAGECVRRTETSSLAIRTQTFHLDLNRSCDHMQDGVDAIP